MLALQPKDKMQWTRSGSSYLAGICIITGFVNFWRFPELLVKHGPMAFVPAYLLALLTLALPIVMFQWRIGRNLRGSSLTALIRLSKLGAGFSIWKLAGGLMLLAAAMTAGIYVLVAGIALAYVFRSAFGGLNQADLGSAAQALGSFEADTLQWVAWFSLFMLVAYLVSARGVVFGLEKVLPYLVNTLFVLLLILVAYALSQEGAGQSIGLLFSELGPVSVGALWLDVYLQAFFSLALGTGVHFILGAYCTAGIRDARMMSLIFSADFSIAMLAAIVVYPFLVAADLPVSSGFELVFQSIPVAFQGAPAGGFFLALYYITMTLLALSSVLFLVEPVIHSLQVGFYMQRRLAVMLVFVMIWCFGVVIVQTVAADQAAGESVPWFTRIQFLVSAVMLPWSLFLMLVLCLYVLPRQRFAGVIGRSLDDKMLQVFYSTLRYVSTPLVFVVLMVGLAGALQHFCLVDSVFAGSICRK